MSDQAAEPGRRRAVDDRIDSLAKQIEAALEKVRGRLPGLREAHADAITRHQARPPADRRTASLGHLIHKLKAKDTTGRWAYYFVLVEEVKEQSFLRAIDGDGTIDLEDFGTVVASCYGEAPTEEVRTYLLDKYGFTI